MLKEKELCYRITGCVYEVYRHLGYGFLESVYQNAMFQELSHRELSVSTEVPVQITYKGKRVGQHRLDLVVENKVILELKAQPTLPKSAEPQLINYLRASRLSLGLLINFKYPKADVKRIVL